MAWDLSPQAQAWPSNLRPMLVESEAPFMGCCCLQIKDTSRGGFSRFCSDDPIKFTGYRKTGVLAVEVSNVSASAVFFELTVFSTYLLWPGNFPTPRTSVPTSHQ